MIVGKDLSAAVVGIGAVEGHEHGQEAARKAWPGDPVLMQTISLQSRRLENQLVLEQTGFLAIQRRQRREQSSIERDAAADGAEVDDGIECLELAGAGVDVGLPAAAQVLDSNEIVPL